MCGGRRHGRFVRATQSGVGCSVLDRPTATAELVSFQRAVDGTVHWSGVGWLSWNVPVQRRSQGSPPTCSLAHRLVERVSRRPRPPGSRGSHGSLPETSSLLGAGIEVEESLSARCDTRISQRSASAETLQFHRLARHVSR